MLNGLLGVNATGWQIAAACLAVAVLALIVAEIAARVLRKMLLAVSGQDLPASFLAPIVRGPIRLTRAVVFLLVFASLAIPALKATGAEVPFGYDLQQAGRWLVGAGLRIPLIVLLAYLVIRIVGTATRRLEDSISQSSAATADAMERFRRARTLSRLLQNAVSVMVASIALLMVLQQLQINIMPILTGAGIVGLAVGFGAQTLVKDLISGFFLILENQVRVGDVATINGTGGLVEEINLRTVVLRDLNGTVHVFPNGSIERLSNLTKDFSFYVIDIQLDHNADPDVVIAALREIGDELAADPRYKPHILEPLEILGVDSFDDARSTIRTRIKTLPLKQWEVGRELRRRILKGFAARGIEMSHPQLAVHLQRQAEPFAVRQAS
ncbi:MAG TPA: mechanosensitive ion channel family protein [Vicinamibacterales bacterium]|nr:mechanosensitive ion channel family protein [Vicinamibacterales bacterium]